MIRILATGGDGALTLQIAIERLDTLDLVRRHLESVSRELREEGFENIHFTLSQNGQDGRGSRSRMRDEKTEPNALSAVATTEDRSASVSGSDTILNIYI